MPEANDRPFQHWTSDELSSAIRKYGRKLRVTAEYVGLLLEEQQRRYLDALKNLPPLPDSDEEKTL